MLTEPVSPILEERFRLRDHDLLLGLAITHTQLPITWPVFFFILGDQRCHFYMQLHMFAVILQPLGDKGIKVIGGNTIRCFTSSDRTCFIGSAYISQETDRNKYPDP
ncbi:hypothetical protein Bca4012_089408 [Brassica carinata]|uniref:Uncharacterized protein n=1 Tax=Brassica carinata TaxID=52824 RepID=A0A8X7TMV5_BRACI|nr:hypothetical protein Bca52824_087082 [Brassica carinata]